MLIVHLGLQIFAHRSIRMIPVAEAQAVMPRIAPKVDDNTHEQQADERDDLDATKPKFQLSEYSDAEQIHKEYWDKASASKQYTRGGALTEGYEYN